MKINDSNQRYKPRACYFIFCCIVLIGAVQLLGCTEVKPWQKGNLARSHMSMDPDPLESRSLRHTYQSKEGAFGGYGVGGGGCGCN